MATPSIPYATSGNTGSTQQTSLTVTTANTFSELGLAALCTRVNVTSVSATIGGNAMTLVGSVTHNLGDTLQLYVYKYAVPTTLVNPSVVFSWTGNARCVGLVCEVNDVDDTGAANGISDTDTNISADPSTSIIAQDSPTAVQRWVNIISHAGNSNATLTVDADHANHATDITTNGTGANNVRGTLSSRAGTGGALTDEHTISTSLDYLVYEFRLSDVAAAGRYRSLMMVG
jgi:hypothetical protein